MTFDVPDTAGGIADFKAVGFFPADHAAAVGGKVYANGAFWNRLRFPQFPAVLPTMSMVAVLEQPFHASLEEHDFTLTLRDPDGAQLPNVRVEGKFKSGLQPEGNKYGDASLVPIAVQLNGLKFEEPGDYTFVLEIDNKQLAEYQFRVIQVFGAILEAR